jgi:glutamate synthase (NADPH/NADH) small chain
MGHPRGFLEIERAKAQERAPAERVSDYAEFVVEPPEGELRAQASRCMDCGIPFCHQDCPLGNVIPEFNDLVYRGRMADAVRVLHSTNNFPEVTGRICPAPCEASCVLNIDNVAVTIKDVERTIARAALDDGLEPVLAPSRSGKKVAVVGSGPAGLAAAQQLARAGHDVVVLERDDRIGGLLRYGIPDFKMEKGIIDLRMEQMRAEGVAFETGVDVGTTRGASELLARFDAVVLCLGARVPRDLPVPGRELEGVTFAMDFLVQQNRRVAGGAVPDAHAILAAGKNVVVIGGGDTGSDCVGTSNRHGAQSVTQFELLPMPPEQENKPLVWPYWPIKLRTSSSHEEGCEREFAIATKEFIAGEGKDKGKVKALKAVRLEWQGNKMVEVPGSEQVLPADLVLLAMGFVSPVPTILEAFGVEKDPRGNARATTDAAGAYRTNVDKVFAAGDKRRGQSLVVWAIREGRQAARAVDEYLTGSSDLPR